MEGNSIQRKLELRIIELEKEVKKYATQNRNEKYRILFEKSKDAILIIENGKFVGCNQATVDMLGYNNKTELIQTHPSDLSPKYQTDGQRSFTKSKKMMDLALKNGNHRFEWDHKRANGEVFPVEVLLTTISHQKDNWVIHTIWRDITHRKQIEKARQKEKETLSTILESTPHGITLIDNQGKYIYVNPYFTKITGYTLKDIATKEEWFRKAYPDQQYRKKISKIWSNDSHHPGLGKNREFKIKCKNGQSKYIEFRSSFLKDQKISVLTDVTRHKNDQKELKESEAKLIEAQRLAKIGDFTWDVTSGVVTWSEGMYDLLKYNKGSKINLAKVNVDIHHPDDLEEVTKWLNDCLASGREKLIPKEYRLVCKDKTVIEVHTEGKITYKDGKAVTVFGMCQDITEHKRIEKEIHKFKMISDQANHGIAIVDLEGNCKYVNDCFANIHGFTSDELIGQNLAVFHSEKQMKEVNRINELLLKQGDFSLIEVWHAHKDGTEFPMLMNSIVIKDKNAIPQYIATTAIDLTVQKKLESQLQQSRKMESIGILAGGIAHDFNNLLYMIVGNTELALEDIPKWHPVHSNLEEIKSASLRASGIVKQLLNFSRKTDQDLKPIGAVTVIKDALKFLRSTIPSTIKINSQLSDTEIPILGDPIQINQVLMNLCTNAFQEMEDTGGTLKVTVENVILDKEPSKSYSDPAKVNYLKIAVSDTGEGIAKKDINKIFDPYFTTKKMGKGSGMGLAVVHGIVKNHNGTIFVDSQPGKGACFTILLPVIDETPKIELAKTNKTPHGTETILFVDDEESIVNMTRQILEKLGYQVETKLNPQKALELFQSKPDSFDLVITDMTMPQMTGATLAKKLKAIRTDIPVIICTGHSSLIDGDKAKQLGIMGFVIKPVSRSTLAKTIREVFDK